MDLVPENDRLVVEVDDSLTLGPLSVTQSAPMLRPIEDPTEDAPRRVLPPVSPLTGQARRNVLVLDQPLSCVRMGGHGHGGCRPRSSAASACASRNQAIRLSFLVLPLSPPFSGLPC